MSDVKCFIFDRDRKVRYDQNKYHKEYWVSHESGVNVGDVRVFNHTLHFVWSVEKRRWPRKNKVRWKPVLKLHLKYVFDTIGKEYGLV